tara:strand:- start:1966 stop:2841 length:876 start_codon:yes stop_codon:yes gene_type:complete
MKSQKIKLFCFGFGQVAENFVKTILSEGLNLEFNVTSRKESHSLKLKKLNYNSYFLESYKFDKALLKKLETADHVLISIPPVNNEDIVIKNFSAHLNKCKWVTYLSATSVYGNHNGKWVTEISKTKPSSSNGIARLNAENLWKNLAKKNDLPLQIFRLAGIYSNKFNILKRLQTNKLQIVDKKNHFFSRIHVEDVAKILFKSLDSFKRNEIYNISDDKPSSQREVAAYGAKLLKLEQPNSVKLEEVKSEMLQNFYKDSKKVDNKKMKDFFKYNLRFPTYEEGLNYIFNNNL